MEGFRLVKKDSNAAFRGDVEENTTFYYSNFKLFNEYSEMLFSKYIAFKKDLQAFLGEEWQNYAKKSIYKTLDESTIFVQSQDIFNAALELWLELQKDAKAKTETQSQTRSNASLKTSVSNSEASAFDVPNFPEERKATDGSLPQTPGEIQEDDQSLEEFQQKIREKFSSHEINEVCFKAIVQAFYVSATKVWKEMVTDYFGDATGAKQGFLIESKKFLFNKLQTFYSTKSKMLKPILVITEKIKDYVIDSGKFKPPVQIQLPEESELKNFSNFSGGLYNVDAPSTPSNDGMLDDELEMKRNFKHMQISSTNASNAGGNSLLGKRSLVQANSVVEVKKVNKKLEKLLNPTTVEFAAHYVNNMMKPSNTDWQVSRNFVTNMVEVNYNKLQQLESQLSNKSSSIGSDIKLRFIQPAQGFYNRLMEQWIIFKTQSVDREILFTEYVEKVKASLGDLWNDKFIGPTQNFFMTLYYEWNHLKQAEVDSEQKVLYFTKKVKESMLKIWEENIVKKAEELSAKTQAASHA